MSRRLIALLVGLAVVLALLPGSADARKRRRPVLHDCGDPTQGAPAAGFDVELSLDRASYERREPVQLTITVRNGTGETFTHEVGYPDAVFEIARDEKVIWSSSWATAYPAIAFEETFGPGETRTVTATWEQNLCRTGDRSVFGDPAFAPGPPPPGTYTAHASWRGRWSATPVTFTITR